MYLAVQHLGVHARYEVTGMFQCSPWAPTFSLCACGLDTMLLFVWPHAQCISLGNGVGANSGQLYLSVVCG